jgi:hypothetical protein
MVFTATAVVMQPVTGIALSLMVGFRLSTPWLVLSMVLYGLVGCCWLPVVWLQMRMRDLAIDATHRGQPLPMLYDIYYRRWFMRLPIGSQRCTRERCDDCHRAVTVYWASPWPDVIVGLGIALMNADAAREVWRTVRAEHRIGSKGKPAHAALIRRKLG